MKTMFALFIFLHLTIPTLPAPSSQPTSLPASTSTPSTISTSQPSSIPSTNPITDKVDIDVEIEDLIFTYDNCRFIYSDDSWFYNNDMHTYKEMIQVTSKYDKLTRKMVVNKTKIMTSKALFAISLPLLTVGVIFPIDKKIASIQWGSSITILAISYIANLSRYKQLEIAHIMNKEIQNGIVINKKYENNAEYSMQVYESLKLTIDDDSFLHQGEGNIKRGINYATSFFLRYPESKSYIIKYRKNAAIKNGLSAIGVLSVFVNSAGIFNKQDDKLYHSIGISIGGAFLLGSLLYSKRSKWFLKKATIAYNQSLREELGLAP